LPSSLSVDIAVVSQSAVNFCRRSAIYGSPVRRIARVTAVYVYNLAEVLTILTLGHGSTLGRDGGEYRGACGPSERRNCNCYSGKMRLVRAGVRGLRAGRTDVKCLVVLVGAVGSWSPTIRCRNYNIDVSVYQASSSLPS